MPDTIEALLEDERSFEGFSRAQVAILVTNPNL